jgi:hypothetical protein
MSSLKLLTLIAFLTLISCKNNDEINYKSSKPITERLEQYPELKKALLHYKAPKDSLKRKAMLFLISNMEFKNGLNEKSDNEVAAVRQQLYLARLDTLSSVKKSQYNPNLEFIEAFDIDIIKAADLIENVEYAFAAYRLPWAKKVPFSDFCEYVLPHRILDEPMSNWRKFYFQKNKKLIQYLLQNKIEDPLEVCRILNDTLIAKYKFDENITLPAPNLISLYNSPIGECVPRYQLYAALARSIGLPVAIDYTPQFGNYPGFHNWVALVQEKQFPFNAGEKWEESKYSGVKIFRRVYSNHLKNLPSNGALSNPNIIDVSKKYVDKKIIDLVFTINSPVPKEIYLFTFGKGKEFVCLQKGEIKGSIVTFNDIIHCDSTFFIGYYDGDTVVPLENPFLAHSWRMKMIFLNPTKRIVRGVRLYRKYTKIKETEGVFYDELIGAKIQGSNFKDFRTKTDVFTYKAYPQYSDIVGSGNQNEYNYYRYLPNANGQINIAELQFIFDDKKETPKPEDYYQYDSSVVNMNYLFDSSIKTYYTSSSKENWIGVDRSSSKSKKCIGVKIIPRNTHNLIEKGNLYELFYFDLGWQSLGSKEAKDSFVDFDNVPTNCLLLLRNLTEGVQERIFVYDKNEAGTYSKQVFW